MSLTIYLQFFFFFNYIKYFIIQCYFDRKKLFFEIVNKKLSQMLKYYDSFQQQIQNIIKHQNFLIIQKINLKKQLSHNFSKKYQHIKFYNFKENIIWIVDFITETAIAIIQVIKKQLQLIFCQTIIKVLMLAYYIDSQSHEQQQCSKRKIQLCRTYLEIGYCRFGEMCNFAHGIQQLQISQPILKSKVCRNFHSQNQCKYGDRCNFKHNTINKGTQNRLAKLYKEYPEMLMIAAFNKKRQKIYYEQK